MFEYEQETYGSKGRERIRAAAMAHTGKKASEGTVQLECPQRFSEQVKAYIADLLEKEKAAEKQAVPACSSAGEALPWEREDAPGRDYQSTWNQF